MVLQASTPPAYSDAMKSYDELQRLRSAHQDCVCRFRQAPTAPPPRPPPIYHEYPEHVLEPKSRHRWVHRLAMVEFLFGGVIAAAGFYCLTFTPYCPYADGLLVGALVLINGALGVVASMSNSHNMFIAHLVLSVLSFLSSIALAVTAYFLHFEPIGTEEHPSWTENVCVMFKRDYQRLDAMWRLEKADHHFARCVREMKYGIGAHSINILLGSVLALLEFVSVILSCMRTCICNKRSLGLE